MHSQTIRALQQDHGSPDLRRHERRTLWVVGLTAAMMVGEIAAGWWTGSMALLADGWHMATHAGALGLSALAYWFARARASDRSFSFGTGKVYSLAGYTSAIALLIAAVWMCVEAIDRLVSPTNIAFEEALPVAILGLLVNLASVVLLGHGHAHDDHDHGAHDHDVHPPIDHHGTGRVESGRHDEHHDPAGHPHGHPHDHPGKHHDPNLRAAYLHVVADALTSVLAIAALVAGRWLGWKFLDPVMGIVGGIVIAKWSVSLCRDAARHLLDVSSSTREEAKILARLQSIDDVRVADLHLWRLGPGRTACVASIVTSSPRETEHYRQAAREVARIDHLTIEVHRCPDHAHVDAPCGSAERPC
ncbi:MAG: CDF family Co(II)/Ni(II) efflux transporter DmeF [Deltaproteobacteria bacterium]|nr:CDF family Co(II)/Ni(II) efflux transporter DmeF [Deltaproteobacteria bacterium]